MRNHLKHFLMLAVLTICFTATAVAQGTVKGKVVDAENNEPLIGATVSVSGTTLGTVTDVDGNFVLKFTSSKATIEFKYLGYQDKTVKMTQKGEVDLGVVTMKSDAKVLGDVVITSSLAISRKTPVAVTTLAPEVIQEKLGTMEFPEILKSTPGVYATKQGGGYGDSRINLRGFTTNNIAVMVNGIPMNDMENGSLYWSNWAGLSDVTRSMQVQRGLGASKVSAPSVGGTINIVTRSVDQKRGGSLSYGIGNDGFNNIVFNISTGMSKSGWAFTFLGGKKWGDGYIQGTSFEGYNYFVNISKRINDAHQLSLTAFGAPQSHYQRSNYDGLTYEGWEQVRKYMKGDSPYKYNPTFGYGKNGEVKTSGYNNYHKPQISLNHQWQINEKSSLSTAAYVSLGNGYGYTGDGANSTYKNNWYGTNYGPLNMTYRNADGTFAYDQIQELNEKSEEGSLMVMTKGVNNHKWYGLLSTYTTRLGDFFDVYGGIDMRYYNGTHKYVINDLYNGAYFVDPYRKDVNPANNPAANDPNWVNEKLTVGDVVRRNFDSYVMQEGVFGQVEYNRDKWSAFVSGSISNASYWLRNHLYYDKAHEKSDVVSFIGFTVKGGLNYNISEQHNVFANVGYISRPPFHNSNTGGAFLSSYTSTATNPDAVTEKVFSFELGYGYRSKYLTANVNAYYTKWMDKTMAKSAEYQTQDGLTDRYSINLSGVNAVHKGIEVDLVAKPFQWLDITGMFSIGDWRWDNNPVGYYYNSAGQPLKDLKGNIASDFLGEDHASSTLMLKDIKVGGSAQTTMAAGVKVRISRDFRVGADFTYAMRNYADWQIKTNDMIVNKPKEYVQPWRIPSGGQVDVNASYRFKVAGLNATIYGNVENLFDQAYIVDATDGGDGSRDTAYFFYSFGRTWSCKLRVNF